MNPESPDSLALPISPAWRIAERVLLGAWIVGAVLNMGRVRAGFFSDYLSDLTFPAWFYIHSRTLLLRAPHTPSPLRWLYASPERNAVAIFLVGAASEYAQKYHFLITGTFDPKDIAAYAVSIGTCCAFERFGRR